MSIESIRMVFQLILESDFIVVNNNLKPAISVYRKHALKPTFQLWDPIEHNQLGDIQFQSCRI
jgi:hypothetical protein